MIASTATPATSAGLTLRDIHLPPPPPWWPPAPGWWLLALVLLIVLAGLGWWLWRVAHRRGMRRALRREFDVALATGAAAAQLAAVSERLRRAAHLADAGATSLHGQAWLRFLDGDDPRRPFSTGPGRVLLDGPYQASASDDAVQALLPHARRRYLQLLGLR